MTERFDVIIVGGRCAGASLAVPLARAGLRVCLLDRARFPSDTPSTHGIQPSGVRALRRLGVVEPLLRVAEPIERATVALDDTRIELDRISELVGEPMLNVRRVTLDAVRSTRPPPQARRCGPAQL
jgi:2-polyprenyl-6-methoxyphenol hydroxylase-like FAD-dependent oxidoreductase